jgi:hypothetical protein
MARGDTSSLVVTCVSLILIAACQQQSCGEQNQDLFRQFHSNLRLRRPPALSRTGSAERDYRPVPDPLFPAPLPEPLPPAGCEPLPELPPLLPALSRFGSHPATSKAAAMMINACFI